MKLAEILIKIHTQPNNILFLMYIHTYIIYLFTQVEIRQHKADVDLRSFSVVCVQPPPPLRVFLRGGGLLTGYISEVLSLVFTYISDRICTKTLP